VARSFNGSTDRLDFGSALGLTLPFTALWRMLPNSGVAMTVFQIYANSDNDARYWVYNGATGGTVSAGSVNQGVALATATSSGTHAAGGWAQCGGRWIATNSRQVVLNGSAVGNTTNIAGLSTLDRIRFGLGVGGNPGIVGEASDFALWSVELSDREVVAHSQGYPAWRIRPQSLVSYLPLWVDEQQTVRASGNPTVTGTSAGGRGPKMIGL
jgi:hypothetical protein